MNSAKALFNFPKGWLMRCNSFFMTAVIFFNRSFTSPSGILCLEAPPLPLDVVDLFRLMLGELSSKGGSSYLFSPSRKLTLICRFLSIFCRKFYPKTTRTFLLSGFSLKSAGSE